MILDTLRKSNRDSKIIVNSAQMKCRASLRSPNLERTNSSPSVSHFRKEIMNISQPFRRQGRRKKTLPAMTSCQHSASNVALIRDTDPSPAEPGTWATAATPHARTILKKPRFLAFSKGKNPHLSSQVLNTLMCECSPYLQNLKEGNHVF